MQVPQGLSVVNTNRMAPCYRDFPSYARAAGRRGRHDGRLGGVPVYYPGSGGQGARLKELEERALAGGSCPRVRGPGIDA